SGRQNCRPNAPPPRLRVMFGQLVETEFQFCSRLLRRGIIRMRRLLIPAFALASAVVAPAAARAQAKPYFVTYDHHLEEPGNLELGFFNTVGLPRAGQTTYWAPLSEFEYGVTGWWTSEFYLEGQTRGGDSTIFTGWRLENRSRPRGRQYAFNPVFLS